jgi:hypothetical protein
MGILSKLPFVKYGTIEYQVKFYIKKYVSLLQQGLSKPDAIKFLMEFYLQGEPYERRAVLESNYSDYIDNIDLLIVNIMTYYIHYDCKKHYPISDIASDTAYYLDKYKYNYRQIFENEGE